MKSRNTQLAVALLILIGFGIAVLFIRSGFSKEERVGEVPTTRRRPLASANNTIDVGETHALGNENGYYSEVKSTLRSGTSSDEEMSDKDLTKEECQAFHAHVERLEVRANPSAKSGFSDPDAVAAMGDMCKKNGISPRFARCAMTKESTKDFLECGSDDIRKARHELRDVVRDLERAN